ncbi:hypothetical protein ALC57_02079 [Trachymyrmex cornetzi]|uniref:THAP domain-containing protein 9 n=1 Tax=Trachymyrmex cornetzi TaxID=471704 RepID=A0A151JPH9_9HYME|nr:hypothetical protein ALC57_02079 [Trachymyrmex cornetzi]
MKVNEARNIFSNDVSSALQLFADENNKPEYITTAWFVNIVSKWFILMTSRNCSVALGKKHENVYNTNVEFLNEIINIFNKLKKNKSIMKTCKFCKNCIKSVVSKTALSYSFTKLTRLKCYTNNSLFFVNIETLKVFIKFEQMFQHYFKYIVHMKSNQALFLIKKFSTVKANRHILKCHSLYLQIIKKFVIFRLKPAAYDACFPAGLLAGLESCHCIDYDTGTDSITSNTVARF